MLQKKQAPKGWLAVEVTDDALQHDPGSVAGHKLPQEAVEPDLASETAAWLVPHLNLLHSRGRRAIPASVRLGASSAPQAAWRTREAPTREKGKRISRLRATAVYCDSDMGPGDERTWKH